jgi:5'-deoxynucleotidase YfbR-like HD superfamily hydrolase
MKWEDICDCVVEIRKNPSNSLVGTGFFISEDGLLLTCSHVITQAGGLENIRIKGEKVEQVYIGGDNGDDFAILDFKGYKLGKVFLHPNLIESGKFKSFGFGDSECTSGSEKTGEIIGKNIFDKLGLRLKLSTLVDFQKFTGGESGSPIFSYIDGEYKVVGMLTSRYMQEGGLAISIQTIFDRLKTWLKVQDSLPLLDAKEDYLQSLNSYILNNHLDKYYNSVSCVQEDNLSYYSKLFTYICNSDNQVLNTDNLFEHISEKIISANSQLPLLIKGISGTGKTSFLNLLYWYFYEKSKNNKNNLEDNSLEDNLIPIFINLHKLCRSNLIPFLGLTYRERITNLILNKHSAIYDPNVDYKQIITHLIQTQHRNKFLIILDGYDGCSESEEDVVSYLLDNYPERNKCKFVIATRQTGDAINTDPPDAISIDPDETLVFNSINIRNQDASKFITDFLKISSNYRCAEIIDLEKRAKDFISMIEKFKIEDVDIFLLGLLKCKIKANSPDLYLSDLLKSYCREFLQEYQHYTPDFNTEKLLDRSAEIAFYEGYQKLERGEIDNFLLELAHGHPQVNDYLVARHVIYNFFKIVDDSNDNDFKKIDTVLKYVQPNRINRLCKEIINKKARYQKKALNATKIVLKNDEFHPYSKAFACYIAGRLTNKRCAIRSKLILKDFKETLKSDYSNNLKLNTNDLNLHIFLLRTVYVSLSYLNDRDAQKEYVLTLLKDKQADMLNRGFHLEYYGDEPNEDPNNEPLQLLDKDSLGSCSKTIRKLCSRLRSGDGQINPLINIELHTVCSLVQHRLVKGSLDDESRTLVSDVIKLFLYDSKYSNQVQPPELYKYISMIYQNLQERDFDIIGNIFLKFYKIKFQKRAGWVKEDRNMFVPDSHVGESVADHTYGTYLIASFLLPDKWNKDSKYDKKQIIDMLLIHDLSEAITGDIIGKKETDRKNEEEIYKEIELLDTYDGFAKLNYIAKLWGDFEREENLNSKIAKEIDKLDNLIQLWIYAADFNKIPHDFTEWHEGIQRSINTEIGVEIRNRLLKFYEKFYKSKIENLLKKYGFS